jgi:hypothetical protein
MAPVKVAVLPLLRKDGHPEKAREIYEALRRRMSAEYDEGGPVQPRLGQLATGASRSLRFGGVWTVVIVFQIALSVAFLPLAVARAQTATCGAGLLDSDQCGNMSTEFPADEYATARLGRDATVPPQTPEEQATFFEGSQRLFEAVRDRVAADPSVRGAALASGLSAMNHISVPVELVSDGPGPSTVGRTRILLVDPSYLDLMDATLTAGQSLAPADFAPGSRSVVVNQAFVDVVLNGHNPVGGRLRFPEREEGSEASIVAVLAGAVDVVGVVQNPGIDTFGPGTHPTIYAPLDLAPVSPRDVGFVGMPQPPAAQLFVRLAPNAGLPASQLYDVVSQTDPTLRLSEVGTAADAWGPVHAGGRVGATVVVALGAIVLMLSMAGVYALMSFTVSQRTREIAIRTAVGAPRGRILRSVFGKAALQIAAGVALGSVLAAPALRSDLANDGLRSLVIVAALLIGAGVAACLVPVRRALSIEPAAAIKAE